MNFFTSKKTTLFLATACALAFFSTVASARIERAVEKTFSVQSGAKLSVSTSGGNVRVEPGDVQSVRIVARQIFPRAKSEAEADEIAKSLDLVMEQSGNSVSASAKYTKATLRRAPVCVEFDVTVPRACDATVTTSGGDVFVGDLAGTIKVRTSGGDVKLGRIDGIVSAHTSGGDVDLAGCTKNATLETSGGDIETGAVAGDLAITTSGGDIKIKGASGAITARTGGGDIEAVLSEVTSECSLSTSGGDVELKLGKSSGLLVDAVTKGGRVKTEGNLQIALLAGGNGKNRLSGRINGGGPLVKVRTSGGDIEVKTR
ncbi:DUF4097 family beta strand repeat-containing protein [Ereboglobus luteus]|uniref:DUF4097 domain-containing protein n=1 Tax=Ereboglobus luteus TaxID=1796921 RepID=A0A2U8E1G5_9BACT|nr:DUF4097 family beta strand repeat-containing protein [Ereboglobus luteus]AWI08534.1 hypothetical protein CKA38_04055 [Ereboglobus luteus]